MSKSEILLRHSNESEEDVKLTVNLFQQYSEVLSELTGIDLSFQNFQKEIDDVTQLYGKEKDGDVIFAEMDGNAVGVVALKNITKENEKEKGWKICEMKRLFVVKDARGKGVGKLMIDELIQSAKDLEYTHMRLDTVERLTAANKLYKKLGFDLCADYNGNPLDDAMWYEIELNG